MTTKVNTKEVTLKTLRAIKKRSVTDKLFQTNEIREELEYGEESAEAHYMHNVVARLKREGTVKQPYAFRAKDGRPLALAGLWSSWKDPANGETLESCAIVTTSPNELAATVHDRMPVIVAPESFALWLDAGPPTGAFAELFAPFPAERMEAFPVSRKVNSPANDAPEILEPISGPE